MKSNLINLSVLFQHQTDKAVCIRHTETAMTSGYRSRAARSIRPIRFGGR